MLDYVAQNDVDTVVLLFLDRFGRNPREILRRLGGRRSPDSRRAPLESGAAAMANQHFYPVLTLGNLDCRGKDVRVNNGRFFEAESWRELLRQILQ
jgi:hypothetical protein